MSPDERPLPGLVRMRQQQFLTPNELADRAGVSGVTIRRIERGGVASLRTIRSIARALECKPEELTQSGVPDPVSVSLAPDPGH
jgi:DNA-binding Xre family transcriptional regulator